MSRGWPKGRKHTSEEKMKVSLKLKGRQPWITGLTKDTDSRVAEMGRKVSIANLGHKPYKGMTGKHHSQEARDKIAKANEGQIPWSKGLTKETDERVARAALNIGVIVKKRFEDPLYLKKIMRRRIPSYPEKMFSNLCKNFRYVGNGELMIDGKNPDFVSLKDEHKLVEIWGEHWHRGQNPQDRIDFFNTLGYNCIIIKASELKHLDKVIAKIKKFEEAKE